MSFREKWRLAREAAELDPEIYGDSGKSGPRKARSALETLYASDYGYGEWKDIGIAFKAAGGELSDWLAWCSIDASNYDEGVATKLFENVETEGAITEKSLWKRAWDAGWNWREKFEKTPDMRMVPKRREFGGSGEQAAAQLEAMFLPDDHVNIVTDATLNKSGKWVPKGYGRQYVRSELCEALRERGIAAIGDYNEEAGVWLRVNPMNGRGVSDADVARCANALVESDDMPLKDQERMLFEIGLPIACITSSGGKSLHAIVKIDADGRSHFADRVRYMHDVCEKCGMSIDGANKNPSRLTRLAGVRRGCSEQTLMHTRVGARDFAQWMGMEVSSRAVYDYGIEQMDMSSPIVLAETVIDGVMRRGDKMCIAGPSKAYKSFALIQLAIAVATGGKWLGWKCRRGRVLYVNCEIRGESFRKRVWDVVDHLGADREDVAENMDVWSMRGRTKPLETSKEHIIEQAGSRGYDIVILDPVYKLFAGDENSAEEVSAFMLSMDELAMRLDASIVYCHHHSKGAKGDIAAQDRFSGSGVFARDCDELVDISPLNLKGRTPEEWGYAGNSTAWRIETVIRDFEPTGNVDVIFEYPVHHVDRYGVLREFSITSPQSVGGNRRGEQKSAERDSNVAKLERWAEEYYEENDDALKIAYAASHFGKTNKTIKSWADRSRRLTIKSFNGSNYIDVEK